jgi:uncharacterized protein YabN with tetrapyrrole methylase and pyrophosphatase domain
MPALARAFRLTRKAARVGFDWPDVPAVRAKVAEELGELDAAVVESEGGSRVDHELGDLLFAVVNWGRKLGIDPEESLRRANARFEGRFAYVEEQLARRGKTPLESTLEEMDALWEEAKAEGR